jgi:hypothetical protein
VSEAVAKPLTGFERMVARLLPWFDLDAQEERIAKTEAVRRFSIRTRLSAERFVKDYERAEERRRR